MATAKSFVQRARQASSAEVLRRRGASRAFACASSRRKFHAWVLKRPPISTAKTTSFARLPGVVNSGYFSSFLRSAAARACPFSVSAPACGSPSRPSGEAKVASTASCAPSNRGRLSAIYFQAAVVRRWVGEAAFAQEHGASNFRTRFSTDSSQSAL